MLFLTDSFYSGIYLSIICNLKQNLHICLARERLLVQFQLGTQFPFGFVSGTIFCVILCQIKHAGLPIVATACDQGAAKSSFNDSMAFTNPISALLSCNVLQETPQEGASLKLEKAVSFLTKEGILPLSFSLTWVTSIYLDREYKIHRGLGLSHQARPQAV